MRKLFVALLLVGFFATVCSSAERKAQPSFPVQPAQNASIVVVPKVVGMEFGKAKEVLQEAQLKVVHVDIPKGLSEKEINRLKVMEQQPPAGWKLKAGTSITLSPLERKQIMPQFTPSPGSASKPMPKPEIPAAGQSPQMQPPASGEPRSR